MSYMQTLFVIVFLLQQSAWFCFAALSVRDSPDFLIKIDVEIRGKANKQGVVMSKKRTFTLGEEQDLEWMVESFCRNHELTVEKCEELGKQARIDLAERISVSNFQGSLYQNYTQRPYPFLAKAFLAHLQYVPFDVHISPIKDSTQLEIIRQWRTLAVVHSCRFKDQKFDVLKEILDTMRV
jgi:hypothetical protein